LAPVNVFVNLAQAAWTHPPVSTPAARLFPRALLADFMALAAVFISLATLESPTSARQLHPVFLGPAAVCMDLAGPRGSTSAGQPRQVLPAPEASILAAGSVLRTLARPSPPVLLAAVGFMASEGPEFSRAAARRSDRAASDIAEHKKAQGRLISSATQ
jgi:hypothetical protein